MRISAAGSLGTRITTMAVTAIAAAAALGAVSAPAHAVPGAPPSGKIMLGVGGGAQTLQQFERVTSRQHHIRAIFLGWNQGYTWGKSLKEWNAEARNGNYRHMIHIDTRRGGKEAITPAGIARGYGDRYLLAMSRSVNEDGRTVYIRPMAEMNGHWNVYSAFNANGTRRNAAHSTARYRQAFRRIALIMRGGNVAYINRSLKANGMPALRYTRATNLPISGKVAMVWNPQGEGSPNKPGNQPGNYYPGGAFVDYVANDLYAQRYRAHWVAHNRLYNKYRNKPFMIAEWAPWGTDDPRFVEAMFKWAASHRRTKAIVYFNGSSSTQFLLSRKPRSKAKYRSYAGQRRYRCSSCFQ